MTEHTTALLAEALHKIPGMPRYMLERAIDGYYHEFESPLTFPEMALVVDLKNIARFPYLPSRARPLIRDLIRRIKDGDFDATKEEADAWMDSPEGQATIRELLGEDYGLQTSN